MKALRDLRKDDPKYRIVVFIDDLDRCSPDRALEVLESIKSFFDIEGFVYVIGMDSETINSLVKKKYGEESAVKGLDYLQKIVQLPFHIPTWKEVDISSSISKIISKGLEGSRLAEEFENNKSLIVKAIELNPRQVKRFINNIILAESVFGKPVDELIAVQALNFRQEWWKFLDLITPNDERRKTFFNEYKKIKEEGKAVTTEAELDRLVEQISENNHPHLKDVTDIYRELIRQGNSLREFLDAGAQNILEGIKKMEEHRRALDTAKLTPQIVGEELQRYSKQEVIKLLREGNVQQFNKFPVKHPFTSLDLSGADLFGADLPDVNLSYAYLAGADLSHAYLAGADLSHANLARADLSHANLAGADLSHAYLSHADLSRAILLYSIIIGCKGYRDDLRCEYADFKDAIIDDALLTEYLTRKKAKNIPAAITDKEELQKILEKRGRLSSMMIKELLASSRVSPVKYDFSK